MKETIEFIINGGEVKRFHTIRTIQEETVGHHSFLVAMIVMLLSDGEPSSNSLLAALCHDLAEQVVGDIPGNVKKEASFEGVGKLEESLLEEHRLLFRTFENEKRTLKLADLLAGYIFCKREYELGNVGVDEIRSTYRSYILSMEPFSDVEHRILNSILF